MTKRNIKQTKKQYEVKIPKRGMVKQLSGLLIAHFTGANYDESLQNAYEWAERYSQVQMNDYFEQEAFGKSILVSYNIIPKINAEEKG